MPPAAEPFTVTTTKKQKCVANRSRSYRRLIANAWRGPGVGYGAEECLGGGGEELRKKDVLENHSAIISTAAATIIITIIMAII
jgi:hypothetical protein